MEIENAFYVRTLSTQEVRELIYGGHEPAPLVEWIRLALHDPSACIGVPMRVDGFIHIGVLVK